MTKATWKSIIIIIACVTSHATWCFSQADTGSSIPTSLVYKFNIKTEIGPAIWRQTNLAFKEALQHNVDYIILHMNTYGGTAIHADSISTLILNTETPVFVFIDNNAASAGALISIACDSIYMRAGANIGAATVVDQEGHVLPDKYQSYMRSMMRSTAEAKGRDPQIAEAMVDASIFVKGVSDTGKVLTFTAEEAIENQFCEGKAESVDQLLKNIGINKYELIEYQPSRLEIIIGFLVNPMLSGLLLMVIIGGIYFELQTPGIGFPLGAAVIAAILYFAPHYLEGLANNYEIGLFLFGLLLIGIELFVIPGFGIPGILGILLTITGLALSMVENIGFDFTFTRSDDIIQAFIIVFSAFIGAIAISVYLGSRLLNTRLFNHLILNTTQPSSKGYAGVDLTENQLVGKTGVAATILRPSGKVEIEGGIYDATAEIGYIEKGSHVKVVRFATTKLFVRNIQS